MTVSFARRPPHVLNETGLLWTAHRETYATAKNKHFTDVNHPAIAARQSIWNGMTTQQAVHVITAAMLIFAIGV